MVGQPAAAALFSGACEIIMTILRNHYNDTNDDDDFVMVTIMTTIMISVIMTKFRIFFVILEPVGPAAPADSTGPQGATGKILILLWCQ